MLRSFGPPGGCRRRSSATLARRDPLRHAHIGETSVTGHRELTVEWVMRARCDFGPEGTEYCVEFLDASTEIAGEGCAPPSGSHSGTSGRGHAGPACHLAAHLADDEPVQLAAPLASETPPFLETGPRPLNRVAPHCCDQPAVKLRDAQRGRQGAQLHHRGTVGDVKRLKQ